MSLETLIRIYKHAKSKAAIDCANTGFVTLTDWRERQQLLLKEASLLKLRIDAECQDKSTAIEKEYQEKIRGLSKESVCKTMSLEQF